MPRINTRSSLIILITGIAVLVISIYILSTPILNAIGQLLVIDDKPIKSDAVVVLNTGLEYYPRLIEAASLYQKGVIPSKECHERTIRTNLVLNL